LLLFITIRQHIKLYLTERLQRISNKLIVAFTNQGKHLNYLSDCSTERQNIIQYSIKTRVRKGLNHLACVTTDNTVKIWLFWCYSLLIIDSMIDRLSCYSVDNESHAYFTFKILSADVSKLL